MLDDYLESVVQLLASAGAVQIDAQITGPVAGLSILDARIIFPARHVLKVTLAVEMPVGYPIWQSYSFHFQDPSERCVFRYDMAPNHPEVPTFPHHRHLGTVDVLPSEQPSIHRVHSEVLRHLGE